jgi:uncharacterized membrane protein YfcA
VITTISPVGFASLFIIYAIAALMSGFSGFGFSAIGAISFTVIEPLSAVCVLISLSLISQLSSATQIWSEMRAAKPSPFHLVHGVLPSVLGSLLGVPLGIHVLRNADASSLMMGIGLALPVYALWASLGRLRISKSLDHPGSSCVVGAVGGVIGGICGFPGSAMVIWNGLIGRGKEGRAFTQVFVLATQCIAMGWLIADRSIDVQAILLAAIFTPIVLLANSIGVRCYKSSSAILYKQLTMLALAISGVGLIGKAALLS